ncbi:alpha,alpha-trehalose-phosphate synthase (UDP-forming) [Natronolimnohabitans innermongolicus]|uniref:Alpha,alpha-trehalose-phosphate synthase (UDP-forming) n=1 Tax=Natronolimnohabitans innermongolicus JCM 12255 TaxID=1227499 RepID=L9WHF8_9EURY|nr:trehalose-6-phosphate synthase [Natronolimnohabitans innermongolicus]ELY48879.1 Alpha,alpha-trehalose-phosphate synthase (UDP- forming) [Natronolimnohabitans innermongolicus JCM 12255]
MRFTDEQLSSTHPSNRQLRTDGYGRGTTAESSDGSPCPGSLIVVSNRQPYRHEYDDEAAADADDAEARTDGVSESESTDDSSAGSDADSSDGGAEDSDGRTDDGRAITVDEPTGGLTAGLDPIVQESDGTWIAWGDGEADFAVTDDRNRVAVPPGEDAYTLRRIDLSEEAVESYYYGFSNRVLWPLCHGFTDLVENRSNDFEWYRTVNERFADAVAENATADSTVWLQDYHFALAPRMIRDSVPQSTTVAQFWHIPWPTPGTFQHCPAGRALLEGLLGNDLLGFHVDRYVDRFLDCVRQYLPAAQVDRERRTVTYEGTTTRIVATPMGVNAGTYDEDARDRSSADVSSLFDRYEIDPENVIGLGVDRLDYSKGIPERLAAVERFLECNPDWHGEFTFIQSATPSRTEIETYQRHGDLVRSEVERINSRFGTDDWQPIVYTEDYLSNATLCGLYRRADVMVVSPLVDGMNLVAQEYVAASVDGDGSLLLSEGTGAHETLGSHALTIDPIDTDDFAAQLEAAVSMPAHERQSRMNTLRNRVFDRDLEWWMKTQFDWIRRVHTDGRRGGSDGPVDRETATSRRRQPRSKPVRGRRQTVARGSDRRTDPGRRLRSTDGAADDTGARPRSRAHPRPQSRSRLDSAAGSAPNSRPRSHSNVRPGGTEPNSRTDSSDMHSRADSSDTNVRANGSRTNSSTDADSDPNSNSDSDSDRDSTERTSTV